MSKQPLSTIADRNRRYEAIIERFDRGKSFLVTGHANPDADCLASMVGVCLVLRKLMKPVCLLTAGHMPKNLDYLLTIADYNGVSVNKCSDAAGAAPADTLIVCDTAKRTLLPSNPEIENLLQRKETVIIEIDHHLGGDSAYLRENEIALVDRASSACSLLARVAWKLDSKGSVEEVFSRNVVVTLLTGMVGDTQFGRAVGTRREGRIYALLTGFLDGLLREQTFSEGNFTNAETLYSEMVRLTEAEKQVWAYLMERRQIEGAVGYIVLAPAESTELFDRFGADVVVAVTRSATDRLAEESGRIGLVVYYDERHEQSLVQCRMRRNYGYTDVDLREILERLSIDDGGGHPGAIGFRFPRERIDDYPRLVQEIVSAANRLADEAV